LSANKISDLQAFEFREECRKFLQKLLEKIFERSPLKYAVARNFSCFDPRVMTNSPNESMTKMKHILSILVKLERVSEDDVDEVCRLFKDFLRDVVGGEDGTKFRNFDP
jgi:hypothetical protein